jgi:pyruvate/2-oxoglutarate dehydrogenase complex dihydrolipoamide dehydrogenase (E3) component
MRLRRAKIAPHDSVERFEALGVDVFSGEASFVSPDEIVLDGQRLRGKNFVIAADTRPGIPAIEGYKTYRFLRTKPFLMGCTKDRRA